MKNFNKIALALLLLGSVAYVSIRFQSEPKSLEHEFFRSKVVLIKKQYRGRCDLKLLTNDGRMLFVVDENFNEIEDRVKSGDSLIKDHTNNCPFFRTEETIINRCGLTMGSNW